jgi:hypothetical protein
MSQVSVFNALLERTAWSADNTNRFPEAWLLSKVSGVIFLLELCPLSLFEYKHGNLSLPLFSTGISK